MEHTAPHPRVVEFEQACSAAGIDPLAVLAEAGVHRSQWFRWKKGTFTPSLKTWDPVQSALERLTSAN